MVLLGEPGSGKTVLLLRLALDMLAARRSEEPVPVLLRLSTWDPSSQPFSEWISLRLVEDYGCSPAIGSLLTSGGQLLPILDGLDEMPDERQSEALRAINASLTSETALVVASRTSEYLNALSVIDADVLTGAAAVEIQPLAPQTIRDYLIRATPPERAQRWIGLFDSDRDDHNGRMVRALATPLAASLAGRPMRTATRIPSRCLNSLIAMPSKAIYSTSSSRVSIQPSVDPPASDGGPGHANRLGSG